MSDDTIPAIDTQEASRRVGQGAFLLDVRRQDEFDEKRIPGSTLVPLAELEARVGEIPRDREIVVHCRSGARSATAVEFLLSEGFDAVNVTGGIIDWEAQGLPTE